MDNDYIVSKLLELAKVMYGDSEPFAKYSDRRNVFIFGCIRTFGEVVKSTVHRSVAIYLAVNSIEIIKNKKNGKSC